MKRSIIIMVLIWFCMSASHAQSSYITTKKDKDEFPLVVDGTSTGIYISAQDHCTYRQILAG